MKAPKSTTKRVPAVSKRPAGPVKISLAAVVLDQPPEVTKWLSTEEALRAFRLSDSRALRKWHAMGMPVQIGAKGVNKYPCPDVIIWAGVRTVLMQRGEWGRRPHLTMEEAHRLNDEWDRRDAGPNEPWIAVPLNWDHPSRARLLRQAAAGHRPPPMKEEP